MSVAFDAVGPSSSGTGALTASSLTWSHTVGAGTNMALFAAADTGMGTADLTVTTTATYNGVAMTSIGRCAANGSGSGYAELFMMINPPSGAHNVVVTVNKSITSIVGGSVSFSGVHQTQPYRNANTAYGNSTSMSLTIPSQTGNMVLSSASCGSAISATGNTQRWLDNFSTLSGGGCAAMASASGASTVTMTHTLTSDFWGIIAIDVVADTASVLLDLDCSLAPTTTTSSTTATFTFIPRGGGAGTRLLVAVGANKPSAGDATITSVADGALTWTKRPWKSLNAGSTGGAGSTGTSAEIWEAYTTGTSAITVTVTPNAGATTVSWIVRAHLVQVTHDEGATYTGAISAAANASGLPSGSLTIANNSQVLAMVADWGATGLGTVGSGQYMVDDFNDASNYTAHFWRLLVAGAAGSQTMNLTAPAAENYNMALMEIKAAAVAAVSPRRIPISPVAHFRSSTW